MTQRDKIYESQSWNIQTYILQAEYGLLVFVKTFLFIKYPEVNVHF